MTKTKADYEKVGLVSEIMRCRRLVEIEHERVEEIEKEMNQLKEENEKLRTLVCNFRKLIQIKGIKL